MSVRDILTKETKELEVKQAPGGFTFSRFGHREFSSGALETRLRAFERSGLSSGGPVKKTSL